MALVFPEQLRILGNAVFGLTVDQRRIGRQSVKGVGAGAVVYQQYGVGDAERRAGAELGLAAGVVEAEIVGETVDIAGDGVGVFAGRIVSAVVSHLGD